MAGEHPLRRSLGLHDAVAIGLGSMIGAGVFAVWAPAAATAGPWLLLSLALAAFVAACNALSSAALAVRYPTAGGTYVYGRERLGDLPGYLAGWCFVIGKVASCAAMAMTVGAYLVPEYERVSALVAVVVVTLLNLSGVQRSAGMSRVIVTAVLAV
ncbi:MAG: amino acid permease, partial [Actinomycetota bacterium]|nr:amino acid permease [Actinomycetota bacterium]